MSAPAVEQQREKEKEAQKEREQSGFVQKRRITNTADLMRRGATLLQEPCPSCGGLQVRFRGRVYCINEDDIDGILNSPPAAPPRGRNGALEQAIVQPVVEAPAKAGEPKPAVDSEKAALRRLLRDKLAAVSKELEASQDVDQQAKLLELVSKYLETLSKVDGA
jgi:uncharacterized Zn finger protein (UPF0148 family)